MTTSHVFMVPAHYTVFSELEMFELSGHIFLIAGFKQLEFFPMLEIILTFHGFGSSTLS